MIVFICRVTRAIAERQCFQSNCMKSARYFYSEWLDSDHRILMFFFQFSLSKWALNQHKCTVSSHQFICRLAFPNLTAEYGSSLFRQTRLFLYVHDSMNRHCNKKKIIAEAKLSWLCDTHMMDIQIMRDNGFVLICD